MTTKVNTVLDLFGRLQRIYVPAGSPPVCSTVAEEVQARFAPAARIARRPSRPAARSLTVKVDDAQGVSLDVADGERATLQVDEACRLYAFFAWLVETQGDTPLSRWTRTRSIQPSFQAERPIFDLYFTQSGRTIRHQDRRGLRTADGPLRVHARRGERPRVPRGARGGSRRARSTRASTPTARRSTSSSTRS